MNSELERIYKEREFQRNLLLKRQNEELSRDYVLGLEKATTNQERESLRDAFEHKRASIQPEEWIKELQAEQDLVYEQKKEQEYVNIADNPMSFLSAEESKVIFSEDGTWEFKAQDANLRKSKYVSGIDPYDGNFPAEKEIDFIAELIEIEKLRELKK